MNAVEKLLKLDAGKLVVPEKVVKMIPAKVGVELEFICRAINPEKYSEIQQSSYELRKGDIKSIDMHKMKTFTIIEGCPDVFKSSDLQTHFGCASPKELVDRLLLSGEQDDLYSAILELNGYEQDEAEIKN